MNREQLVEQFRAETVNFHPLTTDTLKSFCKTQGRYTPNVPFATLGGKTAWNTLRVWWGWKIQEHKLTGHIRILDDRNVRRAWGPAEQMLPALLECVREEKRRCSREALENRNLDGIVFCGGGAKGAYQAGVWKRLREMGMEEAIKGVSGASAGALNSLLFAQGDLELAEEVWRSVRQEDMIQLNPSAVDALLRTAGAAFGAHAGAAALAGIPAKWAASGLALEAVIKMGNPYLLAGRALSAGALAYSLREWLRLAGLFSREFLEEIMDDRISPEKIRQRDRLVYTSLTTLTLPHLPEKAWEARKVFCNVEYPCWQGLPFSEIKKRVLASAALPGVYAPVYINGKVCIDGGVVDNHPVYPLAEAGFRRIFVIHLSSPEQEERRRADMEAVESAAGRAQVVHILPSCSLGGTMEISRKLTEERLALGYMDAYWQLKKHAAAGR